MSGETVVLDPKKTEDFIATARARFKEAFEEEKSIREEAEKDLRFVAGDQWDSAVKKARVNSGRPALTFPRCHTFVQQVSNEARQNKPQIKFSPAEGGDKDTAEVYEGMARHIQYDSSAQVAYETAVEYSAGGSFGYYRFLTDYCDDDSFDLVLRIDPVLDPSSVYGILIPACLGVEPKFGFVVSHLTKEEYKSQFPNTELAKLEWEEAGKKCGDWVSDRIRIAEYWYVEEDRVELKKGDKTRWVTKKKVKFCKINGVEILEDTETEWPGYCIPIVPVLGKQLVVDGKPQLFSVVRSQRGPQELINFYKTRIAETLGTAPIQPYMVAKGQIPAESKAQWETLNSSMRPYLEYNSISQIDGKPLNAPIRQVFEPPIASLSNAAAQEIDDMKATAGIYDASLGAQSNVTSGIAKQRDQQQSNVTNMHFLDNLERSFKKGGQIISDVLPKIYDTDRMVRILGEDEKPKIVRINAKHKDGDVEKHYKVGGDDVGKYDVVVTMGRAFSTKRMESFDMMQGVIQAAPDLLPMIGDIYFANSDIAGADQLAERFKKMLPPQLQEPEDGKTPIPPQVQQKLQQQQQELQALNAHAQNVEQELTKQNDKKAEWQYKSAELQLKREELEFKKWEVQVTINKDLAVAEVAAKSKETVEAFRVEVDHLHKLMDDKFKTTQLAQAQGQHEDGINQAAESQASDQAHQASMAEMAAQSAAQSQEAGA